MNINRRKLTALGLAASTLTTIVPSVALGKGSYGPGDRSTEAKVEDALNQLQGNFGSDATNHSSIRAGGSDRTQFVKNVSGVVDFLNGGNRNYGYDAPYRNHYINYWRHEEWMEEEHILYCACCYLILSKIVRSTVFERSFVERFSRRYRFSWMYDVSWDDGSTNRYHVNNNVRMQVHESVSIEEHGTIFYEDDRPIILDNYGRLARQITEVRSDWRPDFAPA